MDVYILGKVASTTDGRGTSFHGFNIIGVSGQPLVTFWFETKAEADAAHKTMRDVVAKAKLIKPYS